MNIDCLVCHNNKSFDIKKWGIYDIYICKVCDLHFCREMIEKELNGNSSPVHEKGINMMENSFFKTKLIAKNYAEKRINYYESLLKRKCKNILDVGCGPGVFFEPINNLSIEWSGIEVNPHWIKFGKKNNIPILNKKIYEIDKKFDVITAHQVLEHVEYPTLFLKNIVKRLKPGGILHFELPNQFSLTSSMRKISPMISQDFGFIQPPMHLRAYSKKTIKILLRKHKLQIKKIFTCGNNHYIWGQVRDYTLFQNFFYSTTNFFNLGSLLIGIAKKDDG